MWSNILVCGANSLHQGFVERLSHDLAKVAHLVIKRTSHSTSLTQGIKFKVTATPSSQERMFSSWLGGSIFASLVVYLVFLAISPP